MDVVWGARSDGTAAGTWMAVGDANGPGSDSHVYRSTDGAANWTSVELSGLTGHQQNDFINGIASDGAGKWMFALDNRIYYSTDDGASFAVSTPTNLSAVGRPQGIIFKYYLFQFYIQTNQFVNHLFWIKMWHFDSQ